MPEIASIRDQEQDAQEATQRVQVSVMRRESIYLHRSVRSMPLSRERLIAALALASVISAGILFFSAPILKAHGNLSRLVLRYTAIPITGARTMDVFSPIGSASAPEVPFPSYNQNPRRTGLLCIACLLVILGLHRTFPLARNFLVLLAILLCAAMAVMIFQSSSAFDSAIYAQIWLRGETVVWILLPWVSVFLFFLSLPSVKIGIACTVSLQIYVMVWSALRLAFCLGVMHYTGILFLPLLWFCLGVLFDLVCLLFFYSIALERSVQKIRGERQS